MESETENDGLHLEMVEPCPVETTLGLLNSKWKILILRELLSGTKRFEEMHRGIDGISQKMLTESLRSMESDGLVSRKVYPEVPPKVEYSLSELGDTLKPIIVAMQDWGNAYNHRKGAGGAAAS
jgi:DNA-binding HxlR family transcriptional regulator